MIIEMEETLLELIDNTVATANDDELFAGGYLRGHISLAAADCEQEGIDDLATFKARIIESLDLAKNELTPADQVIVGKMWDSLLEKI